MGPPSWHVLKVFARKLRKKFLKEQLKINACVIGCCQDVQTHRDKSKVIYDFEVNLTELWMFLKSYIKRSKYMLKWLLILHSVSSCQTNEKTVSQRKWNIIAVHAGFVFTQSRCFSALVSMVLFTNINF